MKPFANQNNRREFLTTTAKFGVASLLMGASDTHAADPAPAANVSALLSLPEIPARVFVAREDMRLQPTQRTGDRFAGQGVEVRFQPQDGGTAVVVHCPTGPLSRVVLRWDANFPEDALYLGDHWERSYGDLQWRFLQPERVLPWYFAAHHAATGRTFMAGVKTQPAAFSFWMVDAAGISLWLDFRNGGSPSLPGDREIPAATIVSLNAQPGESPQAALTRFCRLMCPAPRLSPTPICGNNNWYYAYGRNFDANAMRRDAAFLAELAHGHSVKPFCVIDAGWTSFGEVPGGPWTGGDPKRFPDMPGLAADIRKLGVRPGIWMRPTALSRVDDPRRLRPGPDRDAEKALDLSLPENLALIHEDVARVHSWGYELIKHDFSTYDVFCRWGFQFGAELTDSDWHFHDQTLTNAELILRHYRTLRAAAGDAILLGCNTVGHLGAGLFEIQRTGDDTSGKAWERTRRMGVNTLAYRLPQNRTFFNCDPDCAPHTADTPWELDRQFLDVVARSGAALFVSVDPRTVTPDQKAAFHAAMQTALSGGTPGGCEPLDWLHNTAPAHWRFGPDTTTYHWEDPSGISPIHM